MVWRVHIRGAAAELPAGAWCILAALCALAGLLVMHAATPAPLHGAIAVHSASRKPAAAPKPFEFPAGGRVLAGKYRLVALYGSPDSPALGVLGEQPPGPAIARAQAVAAAYQPLSAAPILPAFEIIATIASGTPTDNGNYSRELDPAVIKPWIEAARQAGIYVVLDLQPGRADFLSQAKQYESLLAEPNVGLALDPEWRLKPDQVPLRQIGTVDIAEINSVASWLAGVTAINNLPQKLFVLHQFRLDMLPAREQLDTSHRELAYIIQMDGQGSQAAKADTWRSITASPPPGVNFGWKNFYDEDQPMLDPAGTMQLSPQPWYISYQ
jgi:hypothetical protein